MCIRDSPLHTAMSIYGCMLGYTLISAEMADEDLRSFIQKIGYIEAMPVVIDPGVLNPYEFIGAVINRRLPNPFMPDAPQRIACLLYTSGAYRHPSNGPGTQSDRQCPLRAPAGSGPCLSLIHI